MKQIIDNAINDVRNAFPSIYSKDDVISVLEGLKEHVGTLLYYENSNVDKKKLKEVLENVIDKAANRFDEDIISNVEFRIDYGNTIEIDSCDIEAGNISRIIYEEVEEAIDDLFPDA